MMNVVIPILVGFVYVSLCSLFREPSRISFNAIMIAGAGAAYLSGGFGVWEFAFTAVVTFCAYRGLRSYHFIGVGWLLHTAWDVLHHLYGNPIIPFVPTSSLGCAICDPVIAVWCFAGGRSLIRGSRQGSAMPDFSTAARVGESGRFSSCAGFRDPEADRVLPPRVSELLQLSAESIRIPHATQHQWHVTSRLPLQNKLLRLSDSPPSVPLSLHRPFT